MKYKHEMYKPRVYFQRSEIARKQTTNSVYCGAIGADNKFPQLRPRSPIRDRFRARDVCRPAFTPFGNKVARIPQRLSRRAIATGRVSNRRAIVAQELLFHGCSRLQVQPPLRARS
jgi:hypothetical protein